MGIEPTYLAWKASVLPLNYTRMFFNETYDSTEKSEMQVFFQKKFYAMIIG